MYDDTNAWGRRNTNEAVLAEMYLAKHPEIRQMIKDCHAEVESLLESYGEFLSKDERIKARLLNTAIREPSKYRDMFMPNVLFASYNVWDASHEKYPRILRAIAQYNPEYLNTCMSDHARKMRVCKVPIYELKK